MALRRRGHGAAPRQARRRAAWSSDLDRRRDGRDDDRRDASCRETRRARRRRPTQAACCVLDGPDRRRRSGPAGASTRRASRSTRGEIVGIAGVSGNGQSELVEVLAGQRPATGGEVLHRRRGLSSRPAPRSPAARCLRPAGGAAAERLRAAHDGGREHGLPRLRPAARRHARLVAATGAPCAATRRELIAALPDQDRLRRTRPIEQPLRRQRPARRAGARAVRRRRRADRRQPLLRPRLRSRRRDPLADHGGQRNRGAAVLLVSEDLDEILELADRILVMSRRQDRLRDRRPTTPTARPSAGTWRATD